MFHFDTDESWSQVMLDLATEDTGVGILPQKLHSGSCCGTFKGKEPKKYDRRYICYVRIGTS